MLKVKQIFDHRSTRNKKLRTFLFQVFNGPKQRAHFFNHNIKVFFFMGQLLLLLKTNVKVNCEIYIISVIHCVLLCAG